MPSVLGSTFGSIFGATKYHNRYTHEGAGRCQRYKNKYNAIIDNNTSSLPLLVADMPTATKVAAPTTPCLPFLGYFSHTQKKLNP